MPKTSRSEIPTKKDFSNIRFSEDKLLIDLKQLQQLFNDAAFWAQNRSLDDLAIAIANSDPVITIWEQENLIGFARATSDCVYRASIWDVIVHPQYQGYGLGRKLIQNLLKHPRLKNVERVYLMTTYQQGFYARLGFEYSNPSTSMVIYNRQKIVYNNY